MSEKTFDVDTVARALTGKLRAASLLCTMPYESLAEDVIGEALRSPSLFGADVRAVVGSAVAVGQPVEITREGLTGRVGDVISYASVVLDTSTMFFREGDKAWCATAELRLLPPTTPSTPGTANTAGDAGEGARDGGSERCDLDSETRNNNNERS